MPSTLAAERLSATEAANTRGEMDRMGPIILSAQPLSRVKLIRQLRWRRVGLGGWLGGSIGLDFAIAPFRGADQDDEQQQQTEQRRNASDDQVIGGSAIAGHHGQQYGYRSSENDRHTDRKSDCAIHRFLSLNRFLLNHTSRR